MLDFFLLCGDNLLKGTIMAGMEIIIVNPTSKCLSRFFFLFLSVLVACLILFSAVVHGGDIVDGYGKENRF
jgi:hypothetical protein